MMIRTVKLYIGFLALCIFSLLVTADVDDKKPSYKAKPTTAIRAGVYDRFNKAQKYQEQKQYTQALGVLDALKQRAGRQSLNSYEKAQLWNFYAYVFLAQDDHRKAIQSFEKVLGEEDIHLGLVVSTKYILAQLYFANDDIEEGIATLEEWFELADNPGPDAYILLAQGYLQKDKIDKALAPLLSAFDVAEAQGKQAKENWYALLQYVYGEKKQYAQQESILEILVDRWPKDNYWLALIGIYSQLEKTDQQLYAMEAAYVQNMLKKEAYLVSLAQLLSAAEAPYKAAKVMEKGFAEGAIEQSLANLQRAGEYWRRSQETAKALPLLKEAAQLADDGEAAMRLAYVYMSLYRYQDAAQQIALAFKKGGIKHELDAEFLRGQAYFYLHQFDRARQAFQSVLSKAEKKKLSSDRDKRVSKQTEQWLSYMQYEMNRAEEIKQYLL